MLIHRLADLRAATSPKDLQAGQPRTLAGETMAIDLAEGFQMNFSANHRKTPRSPNNITDWSRVHRVKVVFIGKGSQP
jgi:hypothetical protein